MPTGRHCSSCGRGWYCSLHCQNKMDVYHLFECGYRPLTTADYLCRDCLDDWLPINPEVMEDFGFNRCKDHRQMSHLLGIYIGIFKHKNIPAETVDMWRREKSLLKNIIQVYEGISEAARGSYFPWLLRNTHILSQDADTESREDPGESELERILNAARPYLENEDRSKAVEELEPPGKLYCFFFFSFAVEGINPPPTDGKDFWYNFGFPVIIGKQNDLSAYGIRHAEGQLGAFYSRLVCGHKSTRDYEHSLGVPTTAPPDPPTCSFEEFWKSWCLLILPIIFDKYGYRDFVDQNWPHLRGYLFCRKEDRPLVWRLCHYVAIDDVNATDYVSEIRGAAEAYGIHSHLNARDRLMMYEFYRRLLSAADPIQLHEACQAGNLLQFSQRHLGRGIDSSIKSILVRLDISRRN